MQCVFVAIGAALVLTVGPIASCYGSEFETPVRLTGVDGPIDVQRTGHSAPFVGDFDADGVRDLLVGEFHEGRLRILRNLGTDDEPRYEGFQWFKAGAQLGRVPTG